jgi:hypothetical protein
LTHPGELRLSLPTYQGDDTMKTKEERAAELRALYWAVSDYADRRGFYRGETIGDLLAQLLADFRALGATMTQTERSATYFGPDPQDAVHQRYSGRTQQ